jgi:putative oxidoreductase
MMQDLAALVLRLVVGGIFFYEGYHKIASPPDAFRGRNGLAALIAKQGFPFPKLTADLVTLAEAVGGVMIVAGLLTRLALIPLIVTVGLAAFVFKRKDGFAGGWDWPFSVFGSSLALLLIGSGGYSLDALFGIPWTTAI